MRGLVRFSGFASQDRELINLKYFFERCRRKRGTSQKNIWFYLIRDPKFDSGLRSIRSFCRGLAIAFLVLAFSLSWAMPAVAQTTFPDPSTPAIDPAVQAAPRIDANEISSEKLSQFVQAYLKVVELLDRREGELQAAETEFESARLQQEIETDALALIEAAGLTLQEYLQLLGLANIDAEFGERVVAQLQENF